MNLHWNQRPPKRFNSIFLVLRGFSIHQSDLCEHSADVHVLNKTFSLLAEIILSQGPHTSGESGCLFEMILISEWKSASRWSGRKWAFHPCLFLIASYNNRSNSPFRATETTIHNNWSRFTFILSFKLDIPRYKFTIFRLFNILPYISLYFEQTTRLAAFVGPLWLYGSVSQGIRTTKFTNLIGWIRYWPRSRFSHLERHLDR